MAHQIKGELKEIVENREANAQQERAKASAASFRTTWMLQ
jgi:hypothetical protein